MTTDATANMDTAEGRAIALEALGLVAGPQRRTTFEQTTTPLKKFVEHRVCNIGGISAWTTICTVTASKPTPGGSYVLCEVAAWVQGLTVGVGYGRLRARQYFGFNELTAVTGNAEEPSICAPGSVGAPPKLRINISDNAFQIQVASADEAGAIMDGGIADLEIFLPGAAYTDINWIVTP